MKKTIISTLSALSMLLLSGCLVRTINPWLPDSSRVTTPALAGAWEDPEKNLTVFFSPQGSNYQVMAIGELRSVSLFTASLHNVDNTLLLMVGPAPNESPSGATQLPAFLLFKAVLQGNGLTLFPINMETAETRIKNSGIGTLSAGNKSSGIVLLSPTEQLLPFLRSNMAAPDFFNAKPLYQLKKLVAESGSPAALPISPASP